VVNARGIGRCVRCRTDAVAFPGHAHSIFSLRTTICGTTQRGAKHRLDGRAYQKELEMRMYFERTSRVPTWIAAPAICLLAVFATCAIVRSIPTSYADIPKQSVPSKPEGLSGSADTRANDSQASVALVRDTIHRRDSTSCRECGVVTSIRQIQQSGGLGGEDLGDAKLAGGAPVGASGAIAASAAPGNRYEIKVRFRNGSTTVLNEATARNWQTGMRVIVVTGPNGSNSRR